MAGVRQPRALQPRALQPRVLQPHAVGSDADATPPHVSIAALSDDFATGSTSMATRGWTEVDDSTTPAGDGAIVNATCVLGTGYLFQVDAGGTAGSYHFNNNRGCQWTKTVTAGRWAVECFVEVENDAGTGNPPNSNYRMCGLIAHANHADLLANFFAVGFGVSTLSPRAHYLNVENGVTAGTGVSATLGYWDAYLRILRDYNDSDRWVAQYKENAIDSWITLVDMQREGDAIPLSAEVGPAVWSDQATHDIRGNFTTIDFYEVGPGDFP